MKIFNLFLGLSLAAGRLSLTACKDDKESDIPTPTTVTTQALRSTRSAAARPTIKMMIGSRSTIRPGQR